MSRKLCLELLKYSSAQRPNEFIHVTDSKAFKMMLDFGELSSPMRLLRNNVAVPGGELTKGGLKYIQSEGSTSFTTVNNENWPLYKLMQNYTKKAKTATNAFGVESAGWSKTNVETLRDYAWIVQSYLTSTVFMIGQDLNVFLLLLARHAPDIGKAEFDRMKDSTIASLDQVIRFLYFILCVGRVKVTRPGARNEDSMKILTRIPHECTTNYFRRLFHSRSYTSEQFSILQKSLGDSYVIDTTFTKPFTPVRKNGLVTAHRLADDISHEPYCDVSLVENLEDRLDLLRSMTFSSFAPSKSLYNRVKDYLQDSFITPFPVVLFYKGTNLYYFQNGEWRPNATNLRIGTDITKVGVLSKDTDRLESMLNEYPWYALEVVNVDRLVEESRDMSGGHADAGDSEHRKNFPRKRKWLREIDS